MKSSTTEELRPDQLLANQEDMLIKKKIDKISQTTIEENIESGPSIYDIYKGQALERLTGYNTDQEALTLGHYGGKANVAINTLVVVQKVLNRVSSLDPELIPCEKKTRKGKVLIKNRKEAELLHPEYQVIEIQGLLFYAYPGYQINSRKIELFAYNVARASGSYQGETKKSGLETLGNVKTVPVIPQMNPMMSGWQEATEDGESEEE